MSIYQNIDMLLAEKGLSRRELAEKCGLNYNSLLSQFSRKTKRFPRSSAEKIAKFLDVAVDDLYADVIVPEVVVTTKEENLKPADSNKDDPQIQIQQIVRAFQSYRDPEHRKALVVFALQQLMDEF